MANAEEAPIFRLPEELLLRVAFSLPNSFEPKHLKNFCLASKQFRPAAQEALHRFILLGDWFDYNFLGNAINPAIKLLRTLIDRPDLATKVRFLVLRALQSDVSMIYAKLKFDLQALRSRCLRQLENLGCEKIHPWCRSLENSIESAFVGVLLVLLPNITHADLMIHYPERDLPCTENLSAWFGRACPPQSLLSGWKRLQNLAISDLNLLRCGINLENLTALRLKYITPIALLSLNGRACLEGTTNLQDLSLEVSADFLHDPAEYGCDVHLKELLEALDCKKLRELSILLQTEFSALMTNVSFEDMEAGYFLSQISSVQDTLETLTIDFEGLTERRIDVLLSDIFASSSMKNFTSLKKLEIPTAFLLEPDTETSPLVMQGDDTKTCLPRNLPPMLESLVLLYPAKHVEGWARIFFLDKNLKNNPCLPNFKDLVLSCHDEIGDPAEMFTDMVDGIWDTLFQYFDIRCSVHCQTHMSNNDLAELYREQREHGLYASNFLDDSDDDEEDEETDEDEDEAEDDSDMLSEEYSDTQSSTSG